MLRLSTTQLDDAVQRGILTRGQADELWRFLAAAEPSAGAEPARPVQVASRFTFTNVLYYFGGLIAIGAMTLFMTLGYEAFGGWGIFVISGIYAALALAATHFLMQRGLTTPAGIMAALAISLVPLAIYGLQNGMGSWPVGRPYRDYHVLIDWRWAVMELGTLLAGAVVLFFYRAPFAVMPLAVTLWYMSMDFAPLLAGGNEDADWRFRKLVSMVFGVLMLILAGYVDVRTRRRPDFGFWLCFFGAVAFWGALSMMDSGSQLGKFLYAVLNAGLIFIGAVLGRRIFTVLGGLGVCGYLGYLSYSVFKDSLLFPLALTAIGLGLVAMGIWWQKHEHEIQQRFRGVLPGPLRSVVEAEG